MTTDPPLEQKSEETARPGATLREAAQDAGEAMVEQARKSGVEIKKLVIAIHGIGDQYRQATIQSVVTRFGYHFDFPAAVPLGSFYATPGKISAFTLKSPPIAPPDLAGIGFVEAYWADIPRRIQRRGYTIEESKAWARTIVERVRARYGPEVEGEFRFRRENFQLAAAVIEEMIDTIAVLGNLLFLAEKAGILKFDLDQLLTSYLGDVQVVADFANYRSRIVAQFGDVLGPVFNALAQEGEPGPEIYIVAHSEGTVIAFMALLQAMCAPPTNAELPAPPPRPAWIERVRGFMTIGSPIDKHIVLWPGIWDAVENPGRGPAAGPIRWRNYYDYGDPVGFELETTRQWLRDPEHNWDAIGAFEFRGRLDGVPQDDFGFSRYPLPGAAHVGYWSDPAVFGHFIQTVLGLKASAAVAGDFSQPPPDRFWPKVTSYVVPYLLVFGSLYGGVYLLFKALRGFLKVVERTAADDCLLVQGVWRALRCLPGLGDWKVTPVSPLLDVILNVTGITCLMTGITLAARIPRLTHAPFWRGAAAAFFVVFAGLYVLLVDAPRRSWLGFHAVTRDFHPAEAWGPTAVMLGLALLTAAGAAVAGQARFPGWLQAARRGMRPLLIPGVAVTAGVVMFRLLHAEKAAAPSPWQVLLGGAAPGREMEGDSLWPLLLGGAAFVYLWWIAALVFDLVFVWHRYIRHAAFQRRLHDLRPMRKAREKEERAAAAVSDPAPILPREGDEVRA